MGPRQPVRPGQVVRQEQMAVQDPRLHPKPARPGEPVVQALPLVPAQTPVELVAERGRSPLVGVEADASEHSPGGKRDQGIVALGRPKDFPADRLVQKTGMSGQRLCSLDQDRVEARRQRCGSRFRVPGDREGVERGNADGGPFLAQAGAKEF